jgi:RNA polymerase sigma-70 factor (ECF subfamily)
LWWQRGPEIRWHSRGSSTLKGRARTDWPGRSSARAKDAEEAVQEAFLHAWRDLPRLREAVLWPAWFRRIAVRAAIDRGRRRTRIREIALGSYEPSSVSDASLEVEARADVARALRRLPPHDRALLTLRFVDDLEVADVAAALGIPAGTVKSRLSRLLGRLRADAGEDDDR